MGSWHVRASAASITGACVFAVVTGAGAVFVGDWWGSSHHSTVVTQFVTAPASPAHGSHPAVARPVHPAVAGHHTSGGTTRSQAQADAQADAQAARVAGPTPAAPAHPAKKAAAAGPNNQGRSKGQNENGGPGQGEAQGNGNGHAGQDPTSAPATPSTGESSSAPAATPTVGGDQG
jgi:hypothetical protein